MTQANNVADGSGDDLNDADASKSANLEIFSSFAPASLHFRFRFICHNTPGKRKGAIHMKLEIPKTVNIIELENAPFKCAKDADVWSRSHGIVGLMSNVDTGGKGEIAISVHSLNKMLSGSALEKSSTPALHFAALMRLRDIIRESFVGEVHPDYLKVDGKRNPGNGINPLVEIWVLYGCASFADFPCRVKTTLKRFLDNDYPSKAYSYEISNIEILRGTVAPLARPSNKTSMDVNILLNGVCDVNGRPLLEATDGKKLKWGVEEKRKNKHWE